MSALFALVDWRLLPVFVASFCQGGVCVCLGERESLFQITEEREQSRHASISRYLTHSPTLSHSLCPAHPSLFISISLPVSHIPSSSSRSRSLSLAEGRRQQERQVLEREQSRQGANSPRTINHEPLNPCILTWRGGSRSSILVGPPQEVSKNRNLLDLNRQLEGA